MTNRDDGSAFLPGLIMGVLGGLLAALLLAPTSGQQLRADVRVRLRDLGARLSGQAAPRKGANGTDLPPENGAEEVPSAGAEAPTIPQG